MRIKVIHNYGGVKTNDARILPGVYDSDDVRLFGLAEYLIENGHALEVPEDVSLSIAPVPEPDEVDGEEKQGITHNELMRKKGRPEIQSPLDNLLDRLRTQYESLSGESADGRWGINTLKAEIAKLENDTH